MVCEATKHVDREGFLLGTRNGPCLPLRDDFSQIRVQVNVLLVGRFGVDDDTWLDHEQIQALSSSDDIVA
jgi:hypothetical protein